MHIQIEGLITLKRNYFQYQIPFFFFFDKPFTDKLIHATCSRRTISKSSFSRRERKKKNRKESSCFQISVLASEEHRSTRKEGGGGGEESEKKTNQMMCLTSRTNAHSYVRRRDIYWGKRVRGKEERRPDEDYVICIW